MIIIIITGRNDHLFVHTKKLARKKIGFEFYPQYFLGVLNSSSIFSTFWVLEIDVPTTDLLLWRKSTQHTKPLHRMICMISRRASHFDLQVRDHKDARRGTCGAGCVLL